jgi:glycosyltransferase involved in cell wall biosynthesis
MIVKNEAPVIERCLDSVRSFIDAWAIVDTGSTDGTQDIIRRSLAALPGELIERPWKNFGHNRTEALEHARGRADYILLMDADEMLELPPGFELPRLTAEEYWIVHRFRTAADVAWKRGTLLQSGLPWRFEGVLHEHLVCARERYMREVLPGPTIWVHFDSARNADPIEKFRSDARILEQALVDEPNNARYVFYLAQSYRDSHETAKAIAMYERRATMGGFEEEVYFSKFEAARLGEESNAPWPLVCAGYLDAYQTRPVRAEPLVALARSYRGKHAWALAELFARAAVAIPVPEDGLFVDLSAYQWRALDELAIATFYTGKIDEATALNERLLASPLLPPGERPRIESNLALCRARRTS